jgi:membrane-associated phospholipid phosphatase
MVSKTKDRTVNIRSLGIVNPKIWILTFIILIAFISFSYCYLDVRIAEYFHTLQHTPLVALASILTQLGEGVYYIVPSLLLYLFFRKRNTQYKKISLFILATTASSGILVNILKAIFGRFRPKMYFSEHLYGFDWLHTSSSMVSFPSGHSATAMGAWLAFSLIIPKYRLLFLTIGVLITSTRMIVTAHYLSDIVMGSYIGIIVTLVCYHIIFVKNSEENM